MLDLRTLASLAMGCLTLASACAEEGNRDSGAGGQPDTGTSTSSGSSNDAGGSSSGGATTGTGGIATGGGGAGGAATGSTGGFPDPFEGYPDWVQRCVQSRHLAQCPSCFTPECIVCTYGTDAEIADTESSCSETPATYAQYCDCAGCDNSADGVCRYP